MQDHMPNLASEFLVFKMTACQSIINCSLVVSRQSCSYINALRLIGTFAAIINQLAIENIGVMNFTGDGANENVQFQKSSCDTALQDFLSDDTKALFTKYGIEDYLAYEPAKKDPYTYDLIFAALEDMPHLLKRMVNALNNSSRDAESRDLHHGEQCLNLNMIKYIWELTGGNDGLHDTKCKELHFEKDNFSKQRVYLSAQVVSQSVINMINLAFEDDEMKRKISHTRDEYEPLVQFCAHINRYTDIINGRDGTKSYKAYWTPNNAMSVMDELLNIFSWFHKWEKKNESLHLPKTKFLPHETWNGFKRMIFGYVGMIDYYVKGRGMTIVPKRTTSDPCEHLFSTMRYNSGSTNAVTTKSANATVIRHNFVNGIKPQPGVGGSYSHAPTLFDDTNVVIPEMNSRKFSIFKG